MILKRPSGAAGWHSGNTMPDQIHELGDRLKQARELSWQHRGKKITFFLPGMFRLNGHTGRYPAVSITGSDCALKCDHCQGKILASMVAADSPERLVARCRELEKKGNLGVLISGGCLEDGSMPWQDFLPVIETIKTTTNLFVSIHCGLVNDAQAEGMKQAGVDQALIDVIGSDKSFKKIYHVPFGVEKIEAAMASLAKAGLPMVPHIVCGIDYGRIKGEYRAVEMVSQFEIAQLVVVSLMRIPGTPTGKADPPAAEDVADILAQARLAMPDAPISIGCARQRGNSRLEELAIHAGVNCMALPSEEAVERALKYGLDIRYQPTCCSVPVQYQTGNWHKER